MFQTEFVEKIKTHFMFNNSPPPKKKIALYEIIWKNTVELGRPQVTVWCMCSLCWIPKATNTHTDFVILLTFFSTAAVVAHMCPFFFFL